MGEETTNIHVQCHPTYIHHFCLYDLPSITSNAVGRNILMVFPGLRCTQMVG